jgi:hypothetical protein
MIEESTDAGGDVQLTVPVFPEMASVGFDRAKVGTIAATALELPTALVATTEKT